MVTRPYELGAVGEVIACCKTSVLSFRALFNWRTPRQFLLAMVATPIMELIFYSLLGSNLGAENPRFFLLGGSMLAACTPAVAGGMMALTSERHFGTFEFILISRRSRSYLLLARAIPYSFMGVLASVLTLFSGMIALRLTIPAGELAAFVILLFFGSLSSAFFGMALGVLGLMSGNVFLLMNVAISAISIGAALIVPITVQPVWAQTASQILPMRHAAESVRELGAASTIETLLWGVGGELMIATGWAAVMFVSFVRFESRIRRAG